MSINRNSVPKIAQTVGKTDKEREIIAGVLKNLADSENRNVVTRQKQREENSPETQIESVDGETVYVTLPKSETRLMFVFHFPDLESRDSFLSSERSIMDVQDHGIMCQIEIADPNREVSSPRVEHTDVPELSKKSIAQRATELGITTSALESALFEARKAFSDTNKRK